ncbi:MAG: hypothetical protein HQL54_03450 [Magnetococcales bacterium]|nr:hypothetical protein [Magnetococcales bacterium]
MMSNPDRYVMLISSMPYLGRLFDTRELPLSWTSLNKRLTILEAEDAKRLHRIESLFEWANEPEKQTDLDVQHRYKKVEPALTTETLRKMVHQRLEMRTVLVALRRQMRGERLPPTDPSWGFGRWVGEIQRNWNAPGLGVDRVFTWIPKARKLLENKQTLEMERLVLSLVWTQLGQYAEWHQFDFEAVVIYVQRWKLVRWWSHYEKKQAGEKFNALVDHALGQSSGLFREDDSHERTA